MISSEGEAIFIDGVRLLSPWSKSKIFLSVSPIKFQIPKRENLMDPAWDRCTPPPPDLFFLWGIRRVVGSIDIQVYVGGRRPFPKMGAFHISISYPMREIIIKESLHFC